MITPPAGGGGPRAGLRLARVPLHSPSAGGHAVDAEPRREALLGDTKVHSAEAQGHSRRLADDHSGTFVSALTFNVALGREVEFYNRVNSNDPANSAIIMMVLREANLISDAALKDLDTFAAILATAADEVTNGSYGRKTLTDADLASYTVDDNLDKVTLVLPLQTFTSIAAGDAWRKVVLGYDPDTTGGSDSDIIPIHAGDLLISGSAVVPNGSNVLIDYSSGFVVCQ